MVLVTTYNTLCSKLVKHQHLKRNWYILTKMHSCHFNFKCQDQDALFPDVELIFRQTVLEGGCATDQVMSYECLFTYKQSRI